MLLALLLSIFVLCLWGMRINLKGFNDDYLSKDNTNSIKGVFILLIVFSHAIPYITRCGYGYSGTGDILFILFFHLLSQLVVVMFFFYSGYGVGESFKLRGDTYVHTMPRRRILGTLLNFDIAVIAFIVIDLLLEIPISVNECLLSLTGWKSVGNSNWYIFVILSCYLMTYVTLRLPLKKRSHRVVFLFALSMVLIVALSIYKEYYWFNTILSYSFGFLYSSYKENIESRLKKYYWKYALLLIVVFVPVYILLYNSLSIRCQMGYNGVSILFALLVVMLTLKVRISNQLLHWVGAHLFPIYIYMRLPMNFIEHKAPALVGTSPALFIFISLVVTLVIAYAYRLWKIELK